MASSKKGVTATLGTFAIDADLKTDYKIACLESGISMTNELTNHIREFVASHKSRKGVKSGSASDVV